MPKLSPLPVAVFLLAALIAVAASASPVALAPYERRPLTVSLPKGWTITAHVDQGSIAAQQDPGRKDAAIVLLLLPTSTTATEDQLLDAIAGNVSKDLRVKSRARRCPAGTAG